MGNKHQSNSYNFFFLVNEISNGALSGTLSIKTATTTFNLTFGLGKLKYIYSNPDEALFVDFVKNNLSRPEEECISMCQIFKDGLVYSNIVASGAVQPDKLDKLFYDYCKYCIEIITKEEFFSFYFTDNMLHKLSKSIDLEKIIDELAGNIEIPELALQRYNNESLSIKIDREKLGRSVYISPETGFIASRINGICSLSELLLTSGLSEEKVKNAIFSLELKGIISVKPLPEQTVTLRNSGKPPVKFEKVKTSAQEKEKIKKAGQTLSNSEQNFDSSYVEKLFEKIQDLDFYEILGVNSNAPLRDIRNAYLELARKLHPDRIYGYSDDKLKEKLEMVFASVNEAFDTLKDTKKRQTYDKGRITTIRQKKMDKPTQARELFESGVKYFKNKDFHRATEMFMKAVNLNETSKYYTYLGRTQAENRKWLKKAEESYKKAISLSSENWEAHYYLGLLYKKMNMKVRANSCFREALQWNPGSTTIMNAIEK